MKSSIIIKKILENGSRSLKKNKGLDDFSSVEPLENISFEELVPISFNNVCSLFISRKQLNELGISNVHELMGKNVTYGILVPDNGKWLFGHTSDVGERTHTYTKDIRSKNGPLFDDLRRFKRGLFVVFKISDNKEDSKYWEKLLITEFKEMKFKELTGFETNDYSMLEVNEVVKDYIYNINNW